jgi:hypothetical protein
MDDSNHFIKKKKFTSFEQFLRFGALIFIYYLVFPQIITSIKMRQYGWDPSYLAFYWIVSIGILIVGSLIVWKYYHWLAQLVALPYFVYVGYLFTRYLIDQIWVLLPGLFIFHCLLAAIVILNILYILKKNLMNLIDIITKNKRSIETIPLKDSKIFSLALIFAIIWSSLYFWSYVGFGDTITISDYEQPQFKFSFWGDPLGTMKIDNYTTSEGEAILEKYEQLDSTFYIHLNERTLQKSTSYANYTQCLKKFAEYNIDIIIDIGPTNRKEVSTDFVTQWYLFEMNLTLNEVMDWFEAEDFTNIRGISFDVEGPKYDFLTNENTTRLMTNRTQYNYAVQEYQKMLDNFQLRFPGNETFLINMDGIIFDGLDGDYDLEIKQQTVGVELDWDYYGFMTYMVAGPDNPLNMIHILI